MCGVIVGLFGLAIVAGTFWLPFSEGTAGFGDVFILVSWLALLVWCLKKPKKSDEAGESRAFGALDACFLACCAVWLLIALFVWGSESMLPILPVIVLLALWFTDGKKPEEDSAENSGREELSCGDAQAMIAQRNLLNAMNNLSNALNNCADSLRNSANAFENPAPPSGTFAPALETPRMAAPPNAKSGVITDEALFAELKIVPGVGKMFCRVRVPDSFDLAEFDAVVVHEAGVLLIGFKALNGRAEAELRSEFANLEEKMKFGAKYLGDFLTQKHDLALGEVPLYPLAVVDTSGEVGQLGRELARVRLRELGLALSILFKQYGRRLSEEQRLLLDEEFGQMAERELEKGYLWNG